MLSLLLGDRVENAVGAMLMEWVPVYLPWALPTFCGSTERRKIHAR